MQALTKNIVSTPELKHSTPTKPPLETEVDIFDDDFDLFSQPTKSKKKPKVGLQLWLLMIFNIWAELSCLELHNLCEVMINAIN